MFNNVRSLRHLSIDIAYETELKETLMAEQNRGMDALIAEHHFGFFPEHLAFPSEINEYAMKSLGESYQKLVLLPFEGDIKQRQVVTQKRF